MKRGFTLIELLVVIAIIGLLSTLSVVGFSTAREKARMSKGLAMSSQILRGLGDEAIGRWDFDECSGTTAIDSSGNGKTGTFSATPPTWSTDTPGGNGCSLSFGGASFVTVPYNWTLRYNNFTVSAWIKSSSLGTENIVQAGIGGTEAHVIHTDGHRTRTCINGGCVAGVKIVKDGKWHFITMVGDTKSIRLYIDGSNTVDLTRPSGSGSTAGTIMFGSLDGSMYFYTGLLDEVRMYDRSYTAKEVNQMYVERKNDFLISKQ
jgi:prepilin-type N-terminal cleavage/methylation domain-containing protein